MTTNTWQAAMRRERVKGFLEGKWTLESHQPKKSKLKRKVEEDHSTKLNQVSLRTKRSRYRLGENASRAKTIGDNHE